MGMLYRTNEIKELIDKKVRNDSASLILDWDLSPEKFNRLVNELRVFKKYANELIEEMENEDEKYDRHMAEIHARLEAQDEKDV